MNIEECTQIEADGPGGKVAERELVVSGGVEDSNRLSYDSGFK